MILLLCQRIWHHINALVIVPVLVCSNGPDVNHVYEDDDINFDTRQSGVVFGGSLNWKRSLQQFVTADASVCASRANCDVDGVTSLLCDISDHQMYGMCLTKLGKLILLLFAFSNL